MKEQELLLKELALMLERQDMLSKLTEGKCLDEYGYSESHCFCLFYISGAADVR